MPRKEKEAGSNHIGPSGPCGCGARGSWPSSGPRWGSPRPRRAFCKIAPSLPEYYAAPPSTIALEKSFAESTPQQTYLRNKLVLDTLPPTHGGVAPVIVACPRRPSERSTRPTSKPTSTAGPRWNLERWFETKRWPPVCCPHRWANLHGDAPSLMN